MSLSTADLWDSPTSKDLAREIAGIRGLYCGPAVVGWIAAVWNKQRGRNYDHNARLRSRSLFPDGPRRFFGKSAGFQRSLNDILLRETRKELTLSQEQLHRYGNIHASLERYDRPIIIRMSLPQVTDGLHYTALYKSRKKRRGGRRDLIKFYWMDNGVYGRKNAGNPGLYGTSYRTIGLAGMFHFGAKRVIVNRLAVTTNNRLGR